MATFWAVPKKIKLQLANLLATFGENWFTFYSNFWSHCGQSYKASMLVNYDSRVISKSNLLVITTLAS